VALGSAVAVGDSVNADEVLWEGDDSVGRGAAVQAVSKISKPNRKTINLSDILSIVPCFYVAMRKTVVM
jgi:hypothetical protein